MPRKYILALLVFFSLLIVFSLSYPAFNSLRSITGGKSQNLSEYTAFLSFITSFWGLVINALLLVIAYRAFKNFDVKKQFHNKQLELVSNLAMELAQTELSNMMCRISIAPDQSEHQIRDGFTLDFFSIALDFDYKKFDRVFVRGNNIEFTFPFLKHRNNPLLPKQIADSLRKLYRPLQYSFAIRKDKFPKNYVSLYSSNIPDDHYSKGWTYELYDNPQDFTNDVRNLRLSIINWLKRYGADDINI